MSRVPINHILDLPTAERVTIVQEICEHARTSGRCRDDRGATEELERRWVDLQNPDGAESWIDVEKSLRNE
jgi:hypothetical protein